MYSGRSDPTRRGCRPPDNHANGRIGGGPRTTSQSSNAHLTASGPLSGEVPVVFDDVFLESDSPRSEGIFEALGELATLTQVIVLTHHEHLIEVGHCALDDRLVVQDLPDAAPTLREAAAA